MILIHKILISKKLQLTNEITKLNESIADLNKQLAESKRAHELLSERLVDSEKLCQENKDLRQKYTEAHDLLLEIETSFSAYKGI